MNSYYLNFLSSLEPKDFLDIALAAFLIYLILIFIKQTRSYFIISTAIFLFGLNFLSSKLNLGLTRQLFQPLLTFLIVILVVIFQREIRRFFEWFSAGSRRLSYKRKASFSEVVSVIISRALMEMAKKRIGAIIVFAGNEPIDSVTEGGFPLDGRLSVPLLLSIFDPTSPGHDGAIIIDDHRVKKFGVHLPLAEDFSRYPDFGTRHRATAGITEKTDSLAIVVSEERGDISISQNGELKTVSRQEKLEKIIEDFLKENIEEMSNPWHFFFWRNFAMKLTAIIFSIILWFSFVYQTGVVTREFSAPIEFGGLAKNMTITAVDKNEVIVAVSGSYRDFRNFDPTKDLKILVDLSKSKEGVGRVNMTKENVIIPSYFTVLSTSPTTVRVTIGKAENKSDTL